MNPTHWILLSILLNAPSCFGCSSFHLVIQLPTASILSACSAIVCIARLPFAFGQLCQLIKALCVSPRAFLPPSLLFLQLSSGKSQLFRPTRAQRRTFTFHSPHNSSLGLNLPKINSLIEISAYSFCAQFIMVLTSVPHLSLSLVNSASIVLPYRYNRSYHHYCPAFCSVSMCLAVI